MTLHLPWPPSTNTAYANVRGRRVKSKAARDYAHLVKYELVCEGEPREFRRSLSGAPRFAVTIDAHPPDRRRRDLANLEKIAIDAIFDWLGHDDSQIDDLHLRRMEPRKPGALVITITEASRG